MQKIIRFMLWVVVIVFAVVYIRGGLGYGILGLDSKAIFETLHSFVESIAIIVAGVWAYERFIKNREDYPYPKIEQRCEHHVLENNLVYLSIFVTVTNQGKTKLDLDGAFIIVRQVDPLSKEIKKPLTKALENSQEEDIRRGNVVDLFIDQGQRLGWVTLGHREWKESRGKLNELEPGQTREYQFDFLMLEDDVKVIEAISYFNNGKSAWELGTLYSLDT